MVEKKQSLICTVVICSHRKPQYVHQAIRSVQNQSTDSWRLVIVDSGHLHLAQFFGAYRKNPRISVLHTGESNGHAKRVCAQGWAHNLAIDAGLVTRDLACFLSDDDVYYPHALEQWIDAATAHPDQSAWMAPAEVVRVGKDGVEEYLMQLPGEPLFAPTRHLDGVVDGMQVCCRTKILPHWPEAVADAPHADGVWMDRIGVVAEIHPLRQVCGRHRRTPLSTFTQE